MTEDKRPILRRCAWCKVKHLIGPDGQAIQGPVDDNKHYRYTDGLCKDAEQRENAALDKLIKETKK